MTKVLTAAVVLVLTGSTLAKAATVMATIAKINNDAHSVVVGDGGAYVFPPDTDLAQFKVGQTVTITFTDTAQQTERATAIKPAA